MNLYTYKLSKTDEDSFVVQLSAGKHEMRLSFLWAIANQEQYDMIKRQLTRMADNDPLLGKGGVIIHNYNYVEYYLEMKGKSDAEIGAWVTDTEVPHPQSIINMSSTGEDVRPTINMIKERILECEEIESVLLHYKEVLRWQVSVSVDSDSPTVAAIQPGGWYRRQENVMFRFVSDREAIGKEDLPYVTLQIGVKDE